MCITGIIEYMAGFVVKKIIKNIVCVKCSIAVVKNAQHEKNSLLHIKNRGRLTQPSNEVIHLCKIVETVFKSYQHFLNKNDVIQLLTIKATSKIQIANIFPMLSDHILEQPPLNNHLLQIILFRIPIPAVQL